MAKAVDGLMDCFGERGNNKEGGIAAAQVDE